MKFPSRKEMEVRFHELAAKRAEILAVSAPLREARDAVSNEAREKETALNDQIKAAEAELSDLDAEAGFIARALGGRTGYAPGAEPQDDAEDEVSADEA